MTRTVHPKSLDMQYISFRRILRRTCTVVLFCTSLRCVANYINVRINTSTEQDGASGATKFGVQHFQNPRPIDNTRDEETQWRTFVHTFEAENSDYQDWCRGKLQQTLGSTKYYTMGSQFEQDIYMIRNIFYSQVLSAEKGFYVDSGANHAQELSNTLFFDVCLGWEGLCAEPNEEYHLSLRTNRTCVIAPECIADGEKTLPFVFAGAGGQIASTHSLTNTSVQCRRLDQMLEKYGRGRRHVDFFSLDVEGSEMTVLKAIPWDKITFNAILIETFWLSDRIVDRFMTERGFAKVQQLAVDSLYLKWSQRDEARPWLPPNWEHCWEVNIKYRDEMRLSGQLSDQF